MKIGPIHFVTQKNLDEISPVMYRVRQKFSDRRCEDPQSAVLAALEAVSWPDLTGKHIGITAGSRKIANLPCILRTTGDFLRRRGAQPFIIPAMGSHGGATAEGQTQMLCELGITELTVGTPIISSMQTQPVALLHDGKPLYCSQTALQADGLIICGRIKPHTSIRGPLESGLVKMMLVGLGKHQGATAFHQRGYPALAAALEEAGPLLLNKLPVLCGLGIVENAFDDTLCIEAMPPERLIEREKALLRLARENMPRFLLPDIDVLVVERIGKDISGAGMDPNITGRAISPLPLIPQCPIAMLVALGLTPASHGNASGLGAADITTVRTAEQIDWGATYTNALTSGALTGAKLPVVLNNDREAIRAAISCIPMKSWQEVRVAHILDTLHMTDIWLSESYLPLLEERSDLVLTGQSGPFRFDVSGNLISPWNT